MGPSDLERYAADILSYLQAGDDHDRTAQKTFIDSYLADVLSGNGPISHRPLWVGLKTTSHCNMRCQHCWVSPGSHRSTGDLLTAVDKLGAMQVLHVTLSGGEPLMREDMLEIVAACKRRRMCIEIFTNGSLITDNLCRQLAEVLDRRVDAIQISWDAATRETYAAQRGVDAFSPVISGIRLLKRYGVMVRLNFTATHLNVGELFRAYQLADRLGANVFSCSMVYGLGRGQALAHRVDRYEYLWQVHRCIQHQPESGARLRAFIPIGCLSMLARTTDQQRDTMVFLDRDIFANWFINGNGDVYPDVTLEFAELRYGNIFSDEIAGLLSRYGTIAAALSTRDLSGTKCQCCSVVGLCRGGNLGRTYRTYGNIDVPDPACVFAPIA